MKYANLIYSMRKAESLLKGHHYICFLDFEGTQYSHEMIALGAVLATLDRKGDIKRLKPSIKLYVKSKNKVGSYVTNLTGITDEKLKTDGISFYKAMSELRNYCGSAFKKCSFMTFGNHDMRIINQSVSYNLDIPKDVISQIHKNYIDFANLIGEFIRDDNGNPYSLVNYCKLFNIEEAGEAHQPDVDVINLAHLYQAFIKNTDIVLEQYMKVLAMQHHLPLPIKEAVKSLAAGKDFSAEEFKEIAKKYIS